MLALQKPFSNSINLHLTSIIFSFASVFFSLQSGMCFCRLYGLTFQFRLLVLSYSRQDQLRGICVHFYAINSLNLNQPTRLCKNTERENSSRAPAYHMSMHNEIQVFASCNQINQIAVKVQDLLKFWLF